MMRALKVLLPPKVAALIPTTGYLPGKDMPRDSSEMRDAAMLNLAILLTLVYVGSLVAGALDAMSIRDASYTWVILQANHVMDLAYGSKASIIGAWLAFLALTALLCIVPLLMLAVSDNAGYVASMVVAPLFGFWISLLLLDQIDIVSTAHVGISITVGTLIFMAGHRWAAWMVGLVMAAIAQPWAEFTGGGVQFLGTVIILSLLLPCILAGSCLSSTMAVFQQENADLNEVNAPVVVLALFSLSMCVVFSFNIFRSIVRMYRRPEGSPLR